MTSKHARWLEPVVIVVLATALFTTMVGSHWFADPDAFYHARMAERLRDVGFERDFKWLPFTELAKHYDNQHFLYHVFLIPFVSFPDPLIGQKISTVFFAVVFLLLFYSVAKELGLIGALPATLALLLVSPFTFRLALAKGNTVALIFLFLVLLCLFRYWPRRLAVVSFLYVWAYGGFAMGLVVAGLFWLVHIIKDKIDHKRSLAYALTHLFPEALRKHRRTHPTAWKLFSFALVGTVVGLVVHPFFPNNIPFLFNQLVRIGIVNYKSVIGVGGEWYAYNPTELLTNTIILTIPLFGALMACIWTAGRQSRRSWTLLLFTFFLSLLTIKSRRYIEYYVPIGMLTALSIYSDAVKPDRILETVKTAAKKITKRWGPFILSTTLLTYVLIMVPTVAVRDLYTEFRDLRRGFKDTQYQAAMHWLKQNSPADSIVIHSDWDEFPSLFYHNDHNRYIAGLDPTFLYTADRQRYQTWVDISTGTFDRPLIEGIDELQADYLFVDINHSAMRALVNRSPDVRLVYDDMEAAVYEVVR